jgi:hypothetical protein
VNYEVEMIADYEHRELNEDGLLQNTNTFSVHKKRPALYRCRSFFIELLKINNLYFQEKLKSILQFK